MNIDEEDKQRLKNLYLYKFYGTDKEFEKAAPFILTLGVVAIILILLMYYFG